MRVQEKKSDSEVGEDSPLPQGLHTKDWNQRIEDWVMTMQPLALHCPFQYLYTRAHKRYHENSNNQCPQGTERYKHLPSVVSLQLSKIWPTWLSRRQILGSFQHCPAEDSSLRWNPKGLLSIYEHMEHLPKQMQAPQHPRQGHYQGIPLWGWSSNLWTM